MNFPIPTECRTEVQAWKERKNPQVETYFRERSSTKVKATKRVGDKNTPREDSRGLQFSLGFILSQCLRVIGREDKVGHISVKKTHRHRKQTYRHRKQTYGYQRGRG